MFDPIAGGGTEPTPAARSRAAALIGRTISERYRIVELVAMGGMGAIYRGEHLLMRKEVAIKVLHPEIEGFPELVERFEREAVAGAHISHPNVASASDFGKFDDDSYFLVLEFIKGQTLRKVIGEGPIAPARAQKFASGVAAALGAAHQKGIIHRDLKPRNIMVLSATAGAEESIKLIDFGLAKVPVEKLSVNALDADDSGRRSLTAAGVVMGTIAYMAPETALGMRAVEAPADLYALGIITYEMLTGLHPFDAPDNAALFAKHKTAVPPPMRERNPRTRVPPLLEAVVMRLLEKDPEKRYPSAEAVVRALDEAMLGESSFQPLPPALPELTPLGSEAWTAPRESSQRAKWIRLGVAAALVLLAIVFALALFLRKRPPESRPVVVVQPSVTAPAPSSPPVPPPERVAPEETIRVATSSGEPAKIFAAFEALKQAEPSAFRNRAVQREMVLAAETLVARGSLDSDAMFKSLAEDLGTDGLDILYDVLVRENLVRERAPSTDPNFMSGPARVRLLLARPDIAAKLSPAMKVALDLRNSTCNRRVFLYPRAADEGDDRALAILSAMQPPTCGPQGGGCCEKHPDLDHAISSIQARMRK